MRTCQTDDHDDGSDHENRSPPDSVHEQDRWERRDDKDDADDARREEGSRVPTESESAKDRWSVCSFIFSSALAPQIKTKEPYNR